MRIFPGTVVATLLAAVMAPSLAEAHFHLLSPASWTTESSQGDPQKDAPCGGEGGTASGAITKFRPGQTITLKWIETIYHAGHYRIAFAADRSTLNDPKLYFDGSQNSTGADVSDPPQPPVLLDNLFPRTDPFGNSGQMFQQDITLPNMVCDKCTLQIIQFMLGHGPPNYIYHHCADIQLTNDAPAVDGGTPADASAGGVDGGAAGQPPAKSSGGCSVTARGDRNLGSAWAILAMAALLFVGRVRRRAPS
jgi:hypothetical protein